MTDKKYPKLTHTFNIFTLDHATKILVQHPDFPWGFRSKEEAEEAILNSQIFGDHYIVESVNLDPFPDSEE